MKKPLNYTFFGDDLGSCYYTFKDATLAQAVNHVSGIDSDRYKIVHISIHKKFWLFGENIINIVLEDSIKIKSLEGSQHYSKSYANTD